MKNRNLYSYVWLLSLVLFLGACTSTDKHEKVSGAFEALQLFAMQRSYPNKDIPQSAYTDAYEFAQYRFELTKGIDQDVLPWEAKGPLNTAGRCLALAVNPEADSTVYLGSGSGGLWRSRRLGLGLSWERVNTGFPVLGVSSIAFAPMDSMVMYIATGEMYNYKGVGTDGAYRSTRGSYGIGVLKSEDGGITWKKSLDWSYQQQRGVNVVKVHPSNPNIVFAGTSEGVFRSQDGGETWNKVLEVIMVMDIEFDSDNFNKIIAACGNFGSEGKGIYYSNDGGDEWKRATGTPRDFQGKIQLANDPHNANTFFASIGNGFSSAGGATWLSKSTNSGLSWTTVNNLDYSKWQGWYSHDINIDPFKESHLIAVGIDIYASNNDGRALVKKSNGGVTLGRPSIVEPDHNGNRRYSHSDHHVVLFHPKLKDLVLIGNDGGLFLSFDGGSSFRSANGGLQTTQFYNGFSTSQQHDDFAMGGLQDNSTSIYRGDGAWERAIGGDGSCTGINFEDDNICFGSYQNLNVFRSINRGVRFNPYLSFKEADDNPLFISQYILCQSAPNRLYAGSKYVYRSDDNGSSWRTMRSFKTIAQGNPIFCLAAAPTDADVLYVGTAPFTRLPGVYLTQDGGEGWIDVTEDLPNRFPNDIVVNPIDPAIAYVCFSGFGTGHVFRTDNFGSTWTDISVELPDAPGNALEIDPSNPRYLYYGNDEGIYFSSDEGLTWERYQDGLPNAVIAMDLKVSPSDRKLWIATHGNGTYTRSLVDEISAIDDTKITRDNIKLYPNPASEISQLELNVEESARYSVFIINNKGGILRRIMNNEKLSKGEIIIDINRDALPDGIYYIQIVTRSRTITKQLHFIN